MLKDTDLLYAATSRCRCGAGLAYPLDYATAIKVGAWVCSRVLSEECDAADHDRLPFAMYKVREETSINNAGGDTTRPHGTACMTVGQATCPKCNHGWDSEPYSACGASHHWFAGPCPQCGYTSGSAGTWKTGDGEPIKVRYKDVVIPTTAEAKEAPCS